MLMCVGVLCVCVCVHVHNVGVCVCVCEGEGGTYTCIFYFVDSRLSSQFHFKDSQTFQCSMQVDGQMPLTHLLVIIPLIFLCSSPYLLSTLL